MESSIIVALDMDMQDALELVEKIDPTELLKNLFPIIIDFGNTSCIKTII